MYLISLFVFSLPYPSTEPVVLKPALTKLVSYIRAHHTHNARSGTQINTYESPVTISAVNYIASVHND